VTFIYRCQRNNNKVGLRAGGSGGARDCSKWEGVWEGGREQGKEVEMDGRREGWWEGGSEEDRDGGRIL